ncbi:PAS domain S-box protein [Bradyrhizobium amphicarpaeae]|uniref:Blue-light-activated histidine kinase n=1 Tax=Bradyrhizobium amphicarpaeae TaxID=1404768 RepID=A0A2U8Q3U8_9BRAD|nr:PAS domain S-box protein [Bradyrhizobium amphicarpaeae]AWM04661.1 PAS domain S-box protein [Bradyrhizobium amphicarpaeae]
MQLETHFAAIVQNSFDAIVSKDLHGTVTSWNPAAERIFGWSAEEMIGSPIRRIIPAELHHEEDQILERIKSGAIVSRFETKRLHKDGRLVPIEITLSPIRDSLGNVVGASKIAGDISETVELRTRIADSELQFRMLANNIAQLAWIAQPDGTIFWYNDRWYEYTGTTLDQMFGWGWTKVHHPDHVERVKNRIQQSWDTGIEWEDTFPLRGRDGSYRWFLSRAKPFLDDNGKIWRWFGTNTDITEQRQNEETIRLLMDEVNHRAKNMVTVVQAMVARTADRPFSTALTGRLLALSRNQDILTKREWRGAPIGELIRSQLAVAADLIGDRIVLKGELEFTLSPSASEAIGLAIHELATNATKYGALSQPTGRISISCSVVDEAGRKMLRIDWDELDGPAVSPPARTGFGTVMIDRNPRAALGADVQIGFPQSGFFWKLVAPVETVRPAQ